MTKIYLTRHGETEWNLAGRMQGWKESKLTKLGEEQAKLLAKRLDGIKFEAVYSSPLGRALETAKIICNGREVEIKVEEGLKEMCFGDWEGRLSSQIKAEYSKVYSQFWEKPHLFEADTGEGFKELEDRVVPLVKQIISENKGDVLIVTHTVVIKILMSYFERRPLEALWEPPYMHQTALNLIEVEDDKVEVILHGDISHYNKEDV